MSNIYRIAVDAMGGDRGPEVIIGGVFDALARLPFNDFVVILVGKQSEIVAILNSHEYRAKHKKYLSRLSIIDASEIVLMEDKPGMAHNRKPNSSIARGIGLLKEKEADAFVSAGNTGVVVFNAIRQLGCFPGLIRPAISGVIPTQNGICVVLDLGANVDCKPRHLFQFANMGLAYARKVLKIALPRLGLLNIGKEEGKGNNTARAAYDLLGKIPGFIGNVEGKDIPRGIADVVVCDGFVGNVMLKFGEGIFSAIKRIFGNMPTWEKIAAIFGTIQLIFPPLLLLLFNPSFLLLAFVPSWALAALLISPAARYVIRRFDYREYGGAPLLGVDGVVIVCHGRSSSAAIKNAIRQARLAVEQDVNSEIEKQLVSINSD